MSARIEDAYLYLHQVKTVFKDRPQIYDDFLHIMKTFKAKKIDVPEAIALITHLFEGHTFLILGFNTFLPRGFIIEISIHDKNGTDVSYCAARSSQPLPILTARPQEQNNQKHRITSQIKQQKQLPTPFSVPELENVINLVATIKRTFENDNEDTYKKFLEILESYRTKIQDQYGVQDVLDDVFALFADHPVLMRDFVYYFLPDDAYYT
jgi:paired amphipathic helix protein Sin3a